MSPLHYLICRQLKDDATARPRIFTERERLDPHGYLTQRKARKAPLQIALAIAQETYQQVQAR